MITIASPPVTYETNASYTLTRHDINVMIGNTCVAIIDVKVCAYAMPMQNVLRTSNTQLAFIDNLSEHTGVLATSHIIGEFRLPNTITVHRSIRVNSRVESCYDEYTKWYATYIEHLKQGIVIMSYKPQLTLNGYILIKRVDNGRTLEGMRFGTAANWYVNELDESEKYMPYVREYIKCRGIFMVVSVYDPTVETVNFQPVAYPIASDMHFAMLECRPFADVAFEW